MLTLCCTTIHETPRPSSDKGYVVYLLKPTASRGLTQWQSRHCIPHDRGPQAEEMWQKYQGHSRPGRRFIDRASALKVIRREIRTGAALAARLYWGGEVVQRYTRDVRTGREVPLHLDD